MASRPEGQHEKLLKALVEIGQELASTIDLDELLNRILRISRDVFRFENAIIRLLDDSGEHLVAVASYGYAPDAVRQEIRVGRGIMGKVAQSGEPVLVADLAASPDYLPGISGARSELAVPLVARERVIGVFNVESHEPGAFCQEDIAPLMTMAGQAAIAIENARLYDDLRSVSGRYRELHQFNSRILQSANLGIYTIDTAMNITSWNRTMEEMSGVSESAAIGSNLFELFPTLEQEGIAARIRRVISRGRPEKLRLSHRDHTGELRIQKRRLTPLLDGDRVTGVVVVVEDVTEFRKLLEQTIQSEKLAEVGRMSAGIAHEVNNPLAVISYAAQLLMREEGLGQFAAELVERVESEVERLKALTGSLLSFSRAGETVLRPINLNEVLQDVLRLMRYELTKGALELKESYGDIPVVKADPNKLKQIFINLVMNASQAMGGEGTIEIETVMAIGDEVEVRIADNGPGIPDEVLEKIFEPFFTTKKEGEGTGLGLYICRNIIHEHKGRLKVETAPGEGTTFRILLPVESPLAD